MLGIGSPDRHAFLFIRSPPPPKTHRPTRTPPAKAGSFSCPISAIGWRRPHRSFWSSRSSSRLSFTLIAACEGCRAPQRPCEALKVGHENEGPYGVQPCHCDHAVLLSL